MRVLTNLKDTVATDALIGYLPIRARHSTKSRAIISQGFMPSERALRRHDFLRMRMLCVVIEAAAQDELTIILTDRARSYSAWNTTHLCNRKENTLIHSVSDD
jgi:hypothetical protein